MPLLRHRYHTCHVASLHTLVQAYWPFHKQACRPNQFADAIEPADPKFASWMRAHGKLAVIKDEQVERLERAAAAPPGVQAPSRQEVMDSMYGLINPAPQGELLVAGLQLWSLRP